MAEWTMQMTSIPKSWTYAILSWYVLFLEVSVAYTNYELGLLSRPGISNITCCISELQPQTTFISA